MIALAISLTECQESLSERQSGKQTRDTLSGAMTYVHKVLVLIPKHIGDFNDFFQGYFLRK